MSGFRGSAVIAAAVGVPVTRIAEIAGVNAGEVLEWLDEYRVYAAESGGYPGD